MRIAIFELSTSHNHYSLIESWILCLNELGHEVVLYTNEKIVENITLDNSTFEVKLKDREEDLFLFLRKAAKEVGRSCDYAIITSLQSSLIPHLFFNPSCKIILTIHNSRTWFAGNELKSIKNIVKRLIRWVWKKRAWAFSVSSKNMKDYINSNFSVRKDILVMPFSILRQDSEINPRKSINRIKKVIYPGMLSPKRKKYVSFFTLVDRFPNIEFVLLGKPNMREGGDKILKKVKNKNFKNLTFYEEFIPPETFEEEIESSDLLFSDIKLEFRMDDYNEYYGKTKDSGISYLMINHSIPCLINSKFLNHKPLEEATIYFNSTDDLINKFDSLYQYPAKVNEMYMKAQKASLKFTVKKIAEELKKFIN